MSALPCPFCGSANVSTTEASTFRWWVAVCNDCGAKAPEVRRQTLGEGTKKQWEEAARVAAVVQWNKRASVWQPIETAPRDGTRVLLFDAQREPKEMIGRWTGVCWFGDPTPSGKCSVWVDVSGAHWQPIPEPTEAA